MKTFIKRNYKLIIFSFLFSLLIGFLVSRSLFSDFQFAILTDDADYLSIGTKEDVMIEIEQNDEEYSVDLPEYYTGYDVSLKYTKNSDGDIESVTVNEKNIDTYKLNEYAEGLYGNITLFNLERESHSFIYSFIIISIVLFSLLLFVFHDKECLFFKELFKNIGKKHVIITSIVVLVTIFFVCGCDAYVIVNAMRWFIDGVDIYQFQINTRNLLGTVYAQFPYNPISMFVYGGFFKVTSFIFKNLPLVRGYPYFQVFMIKIVNLVLIQLTVLSLLNYLISKKKIDNKKLILIYYLSIFNPILFYVAFLFVQIDALSLFLITFGLINLEKIKNNNYIGVLFLSLGLVIKAQLIIFIPIVLLSLFVYCIQKSKLIDGIKKLVCSYSIFAIIYLIFNLINNIVKSSYYLVNANLPQSERIYYTLVNYMGPTSIFISIFFVGLIIFNYSFSIKVGLDTFNLTKVNLIYLMVLIFTLSSTIVPTPSVYVLSLPAFVIFLYDEKDYLRLFIIYLFSTGVILLPMLSDYGDIGFLLTGFGKKTFVMNYMEKLESLDYLRLNNVIFTISAATMVAYSIYGLKKSKNYLEDKND